VAEWLGRGLQSLVHRFESGPRLPPSFLLTFGWIDSVNPDGLGERTITEADIYEFSFVTFPQY
jgi:hypothetical protein